MKTCQVCVSEKKSVLTCDRCEFEACHGCQKKYERPSCMQCREMFSRQFAIKELGKAYVKNVLVREIRELEVSTQKNKLPQSQTDVDWEVQKRAILSRRRFGDTTEIPPRPATNQSHIDDEKTFACPKPECRGFVHWTSESITKNVFKCGRCNTTVCGSCREIHEPDQLECKKESVETLMLLSKDTKPCPTCKTRIQKIDGCDHMKCTMCGTHFHYVSLKKIRNSSNHHYNRPEAMISSRNKPSSSSSCPDDADEEGGDLIPRDVFVGPPSVADVLYKDRDCIEHVRSQMYDSVKILSKADLILRDLRVSYLLNEISENTWVKKIVRTSESRDGDLERSSMLSLVLVELRHMQSECNKTNIDIDDFRSKINTLFEFIDDQLEEIRDAYGGPSIKMRRREDDVGSPPVRIM